MSFSLPPSFILWMTLLLPMLALGAVLFWQARRDRQRIAARRGSGDMLLDRLKEANGQLSAVVQAENEVIHPISLLPEDVPPLEAAQVLRDAMPEATEEHQQTLMLHAWEVQKRPQALVALAGLALADLTDDAAILFRRALKDGGPALLDQLASALDARRDRLDGWLENGKLLVGLERAALRIGQQAPDVAAHLRASAFGLEPRCRELMLHRLRRQIALREADAALPLEKMAGELAVYCLPRFPELAAEAHAALDRHAGPEGDRAHIWFDKAVLHNFYDLPGGLDNFDFDAALDRLCRGLVSADAETSQFAALHAADQLSDYFYDSDTYRVALRRALDQAAVQHPFTPSYDWLAQEVDPPEETAETLDAEASLEQRRLASEGARRLGEVTSTPDPMAALAELRGIVPEVPAVPLREALMARWEEQPSPIWLVALAGLGLEELGHDRPNVRMVHSCFYWPLRAGSRDLVTRLAAEAGRRMNARAGTEDHERLRDVIAAALARFEA